MADESPQSAASDDDPSSPDDPPTDGETDRTPSSESTADDADDADDDPTAVGGSGASDREPPRQSHRHPTEDASPPSSSPGERVSPEPPSSRPDSSAASVQDDQPPPGPTERDDVPPDVRQYDRFKKIDGARYERVNEFLRDRTYITAREWAIARLCADFRTETGSEMTKIGENLPELVPFMTDTYTPQAVNQARAAFEDKVRKAGATFLYGAMCDFFTADQLDEVMYEATEVAKFLLEVEGVDLAVEEELEAEDRISSVMREVRHASASLRNDVVECPHCGEEIDGPAGDE